MKKQETFNTLSSYYDSGYREPLYIRKLWQTLRQELAQQTTNKHMDAIADMSKCVKCLAIELPELVWNDVDNKWNAVLAQLHHA